MLEDPLKAIQSTDMILKDLDSYANVDKLVKDLGGVIGLQAQLYKLNLHKFNYDHERTCCEAIIDKFKQVSEL